MRKLFRMGKKDFDKPEKVSKKCSKVISNDTAKKISENLKNKNLIV